MIKEKKLNFLLEIKNLEIAYKSKGILNRQKSPHVVSNISFKLPKGQTVALVGESGSGKTTIARTIAGLMVARKGHIFFDQEDINVPFEERSKDLNRQIQYIFQNPQNSLNPKRKIKYNLGRPLDIFFDLSKSEKNKRLEQLLNSVGLDPDYLNRFPTQMSGGEIQRVAIAQALAAEPKLILCDEIVSSLDVSVQSNILNLLRNLQAEYGITYLFIAHDLALIRWLAHSTIVLYKGEIVESGKTEEVFNPPFHPYTRLLLESVPEPISNQSLIKT
jgi:ABC-type glutathione transport system ATPase component